MIRSYDHSKDHNVALESMKNDLEQLKIERLKLDEKIKYLETQIATIKGGIAK